MAFSKLILGVALAATTLLAGFYSAEASAHGVSEADKAAMVAGGYIDYVVLGAKHMVTGYDHL